MATGGRQQTRSGRRFNTLIVGTPTQIEIALADLRAGFYDRADVWPDLPAPTPGAKATLVVHEVGALAAAELDLLSDLIEAAGHDLHGFPAALYWYPQTRRR